MEKKEKQTDIQGQTTHDKNDKHPYVKKIQIAKTAESSLKKPQRIRVVSAKKHLTISTVNEPRRNLPLNEKSQVTKNGYVYRRSKARKGSPLYGKWHKYLKGSNVIIETVDSPPL
jgi:hypothetical protein